MGAGRISTNDLDEFVLECDRRGGPQHPNCGSYFSDLSLTYTTKVDDGLDPFSEAYTGQQIALYEEVSGRKLDQITGEQSEIGIDARMNTANPYGIRHVSFIANHSRADLSALMAANVPPSPKVLDMGSGWGLSSEIMAFCVAEVTGVDINPDFVELNRRRAARIGLPITSIHSTFDAFETDERFDMAFFYEMPSPCRTPLEPA
jgi:methylase of polypeptide subunit release factors